MSLTCSLRFQQPTHPHQLKWNCQSQTARLTRCTEEERSVWTFISPHSGLSINPNQEQLMLSQQPSDLGLQLRFQSQQSRVSLSHHLEHEKTVMRLITTLRINILVKLFGIVNYLSYHPSSLVIQQTVLFLQLLLCLLKILQLFSRNASIAKFIKKFQRV